MLGNGGLYFQQVGLPLRSILTSFSFLCLVACAFSSIYFILNLLIWDRVRAPKVKGDQVCIPGSLNRILVYANQQHGFYYILIAYGPNQSRLGIIFLVLVLTILSLGILRLFRAGVKFHFQLLVGSRESINVYTDVWISMMPLAASSTYFNIDNQGLDL